MIARQYEENYNKLYIRRKLHKCNVSDLFLNEVLGARYPVSNAVARVGPGRGGTPLYKLYRYVPPQRVWCFSRFGLKTGIDFDHYGLKSGTVFKKPREHINVFVFSTTNE